MSDRDNNSNERDNDPRTERDSGNPDIMFYLSGDALRPVQAPFGFIGRNPVQRVVPPLGSTDIELQVTANKPLLVFPSRGLEGAKVNDKPMVVVQPGESIIVTIVNSSPHSPYVIDDRQNLVVLHPLLFGGTAAFEER